MPRSISVKVSRNRSTRLLALEVGIVDAPQLRSRYSAATVDAHGHQDTIADQADFGAPAGVGAHEWFIQKEETVMGEQGKKDKGGREKQKKAQSTLKEKRQAKRDKKNKSAM